MVLLAMFVCACSSTNNKPAIKFSRDGSSIIINNIDEANILQIKKLYESNPDSVNFITVLVVPTDWDSLQREEEVYGRISFGKNNLKFSPHKPFAHGKTYLVESYIGVQFASIKKMFNHDVNSNLEPQEQLLRR